TDGGHPPLFGLPVLLKDNVNTSDMPTTAGSIALKGSVPKHDAYITKKLERAGAIVLGKLNLSEFAGWVSLGMPPGYSSLAGQVHNAYSYAWTPSGSSAGPGVAASMAFSAATIGTETSGSILSPSDANSIVGIKPTTGLASRTGILPLAPGFDTPGPMVRNVTDAAVVLGAIAGTDKADPRTAEADDQMPKGGDYTRFLKTNALKGTRIGFSEEDRSSLGPAQEALFNRALDDLRKQGAELVATDMLNFSSWVGLAEIGFIPNEFKGSLNQYLAEETSDKLRVRTLSDIVAYNDKHPKKMKYGQNLLEASDATPGRRELEPASNAAIQSARAAIDGTLLANDLDAIVAPGPTYANVSASAGYPTVMVPGGYAEGANLPMGISFLGSAWDEPQLISYAYDYEQASKRRLPPTDFNSDLRKSGC
ncbi:MAG TPA: amidase family protein, partial [Actinomycetota bacterium]|nr:amidase family protein [Actinomycetota bacterium]